MTDNNSEQIQYKPKGIDEDERSLLIDYYVQKVEGRLRQLRSPSENDKKRWIWELLQNARDSISSSKNRNSIDVEVVLKSNNVIFKHNGEPFTPKALNSLIWQKSGEKRGDFESTGRFGTGFLTTHTLSQNVNLKSVLIDNENRTWGVEVDLCREGERDEELRQGIEKTINSRQYYPNPQNDWTIFNYLLKSEINKESAYAGIKSLESNMLYTLVFAKKIASITLKTDEKVLSVNKIEETRLNGFEIIRFKVIEDSSEKRVSVIYSEQNEYSEELSNKYKQDDRHLRYSVAIIIDEENKSVLPIHKDTPFLYCVFPLVGTESFNFPVVVNSQDFEPVTERDRLLLSGDIVDAETQQITNAGINKKILEKSLSLYQEILQYLSDNNWTGLHHLVHGARQIPKQERDFDKDWFKDTIQNQVRIIIEQVPIVETTNGLQKISNIYFPQGRKEEIEQIWKFTNAIFPDKLPKYNLIEVWSKLIWQECHNQTLEELVKQISLFETLSSLCQPIEWLNDLITFVSDINSDLLDEFAIIPNLNGQFRTKTYEDLSRANNLPAFSFNILTVFGIDWEDIIIHTEISAINLNNIKDYNKFCLEINNQIKEQSKAGNAELLNHILKLIAIIPNANANIPETFVEKRKGILEFSKDIFGNENEYIYVDVENDTLWERCDDWIIREMLIAISKTTNLSGLAEKELDVYWLNSFIGFVSKYIKQDLLNEDNFKVLPNQHGIFMKKTELSKDDNIPTELKSTIIQNLGLDLKNILLDTQIKTYQPEKILQVSEVATQINDLLKKLDNSGVNLDVAFLLTSLIPKEQSTFQENLLRHARVLYGEKVQTEAIVLTNYHASLWTSTNKLLLEAISSTLESFTAEIETSKTSLTLLSDYIESKSIEERNNWRDYSELWLNDYIDFLNLNKLSIGCIIPNQNDNFCPLEELNQDENIPKELKEILFKLTPNKDFRNILVHSIINIQPTHILKTYDICTLINDIIKEDYKKTKREDDNFREAVKLLVVDWFNKPKYPFEVMNEFSFGNYDTTHRKYFNWCFDHRFELETNVLSTVEDRKQFYRLNSTIREQGIQLEDAVDMLNNYDKLVVEVQQLKENQLNSEVNNLVSKYGLTEERIKLLLEIEEKVKRHEGTSNFLEETAQDLISATGDKGEEIVYDYLVNTLNFGTDRVLWVSRSDKNKLNRIEYRYDFEVLTADLSSVMWYIDAKATITQEYQSDKIPILIRQSTWNFIRGNEKNGSPFFLARVFGINTADANDVQLLQIEYHNENK